MVDKKKAGNWRKGVQGFITKTTGRTAPQPPNVPTIVTENNVEHNTGIDQTFRLWQKLNGEENIPLGEILDKNKLDKLLTQGYIRRQTHPELPLAIYNYTAAAQYDQKWTEETKFGNLSVFGLV